MKNRFKLRYTETSTGIQCVSLDRIEDNQTLIIFDPSNFVDCKGEIACLVKARYILKEMALERSE